MDYQDLFLTSKLGIRIHSQNEIDQVAEACARLFDVKFLCRDWIILDDNTWTHIAKSHGCSHLTLVRRGAVPDNTIEFSDFMAYFGASEEEDIDSSASDLI